MTDIFNTPPSADPKLEDFVGEGKKYSSTDAAAKALVEKDAFIQRLIEEKRQLEADHRAALNLKAFQDRIDALEAAQVERREPTPPPTATPAIQPQPAGLDEATVQRLIEQREVQQKRSRNLIDVQEKLTEAFGNDYPTRVKARAKELGVPMEQINELAANTPTALYAMLGLDRPASSPGDIAPPATRMNSAADFTPGTGVRGNSYYTKMRRERPAEYFTPRVALEEYNELKRLGPEKFYAN